MLTALRRRLDASRQHSDGGFTLIEVVVAMVLSTIIGAMTTALFVSAAASSQDSSDRSTDSANARNVLQSWTSYLQVADGPTAGVAAHRFEWITSTDMFFYSDLNNRTGTSGASYPRAIWLRLTTGGQLVEEQFSFVNGLLQATPTTCRILASRITASALFAASDYTGAALTGQDLGAPLATSSSPCGSLPASVSQTDNGAVAALQNVGTITISFTITDARGKHTAQYTSSANVPQLTGVST